MGENELQASSDMVVMAFRAKLTRHLLLGSLTYEAPLVCTYRMCITWLNTDTECKIDVNIYI